MRRTAYGLVAVALIAVTGTALVAPRVAPATSHPGAARAAAVALAPPPPQPATDVAAHPTVMPGSTQLVSPKSAGGLVLWDAPYGRVLGALSTFTWGGPTVRPVVTTQWGWFQIRLDSRPNGSTAWVARQDVNITTTTYRIVISVSQRSLTLYQNGVPTFSAPVGVGRSYWPTPVGPSFVDAVYPVSARQRYIYGPVALITASHSNVFTEFDGGDGTVAIHGYPTDPASTAGVMSSHGCIRANPQTMAAISQVPAGTPIDINA